MEKEQSTVGSAHVENDVEKSPAASPVQVIENNHDDESFNFTFGKFLACLSFQLGYFSDTIVIVMISAALGPINRDLGPSKNYSWIAIGFTTSGGVLAPIVGRLGDIFGRRNFLIIGNLISVIGMAVAATAHSIPVVITGSVLVGTASAMRQLAWSCLGELVPKRSRGLAFGIFQSTLSPGSAFGAIVGRSHSSAE